MRASSKNLILQIVVLIVGFLGASFGSYMFGYQNGYVDAVGLMFSQQAATQEQPAKNTLY